MNHAHRTIVHSAPASCTASSARWASSSPRPERSTSRLTPLFTASSANERTAASAPGAARSGKQETYTDPTSRSAGAHVASFSQSKGASPERDPTLVGTPRVARRCATRRPVLPVPPRTSVVCFCCALSVFIVRSFLPVRLLSPRAYLSAVWGGIVHRVGRGVEIHRRAVPRLLRPGALSKGFSRADASIAIQHGERGFDPAFPRSKLVLRKNRVGPALVPQT